ncbi:MAG TPA: hypothetical protein VNH82_04145 [Candidatus Dormibacteraeota bacterium]|nr:hypothetical protein [Candidatus Dormibacteraeota bacterium]
MSTMKSAWEGRVLGLARVAWGSFLMVKPSRASRLLGAPPGPGAPRVARLLGARQVLQGAAELMWWPHWRRTGVAVDAAHALSGLVVATGDRRWRRAALIDSAIAVVLILLGSRA